MTNYYVLTTDQKKFLEEFFNALGIDFEQLLEIRNLKELRSMVELCETKTLECIRAVNELAKNVSELNQKMINYENTGSFSDFNIMQNEEIG